MYRGGSTSLYSGKPPAKTHPTLSTIALPSPENSVSPKMTCPPVSCTPAKSLPSKTAPVKSNQEVAAAGSCE